MRLFFLIPIIFFINSCTPPINNSEKNESAKKKITCNYAEGFSILNCGNYKKLTIKNPWQGAKNVELSYFLFEKGISIPDEFKKKNIIRIPVERIVCLSTTHVAMVDFIGETKTIVGIAGSDYIVNPEIRKLLDSKKIIDVGFDYNLNYELLISLHPDVVIIYGVGNEATQIESRLKDLNISSVINADYLETNVLAKAEWIKFFATLYNKEKIADDKFSEIEKEYLSLKSLVKNLSDKPKILTGLPWKGTWWISGGKSHMARLIEDAGGDFLWKNNSSTESFPLTLESVFEIAQQAKIWINSGAANSQDDILNVDERIKNLQVFQKGYIFNNNAIKNKFDGNDFWESGIVSPQVILKDLVKIFHPDILPDYELKYFKKI